MKCHHFLHCLWCGYDQPEEQMPEVTNVTISDVSWESFILSWSVEDGSLDAFVIDVIDAEAGTGWQNHSVPADARSLAISGLFPSTWYRVSLYGVYMGGLLEPTFADTITGINTAVCLIRFCCSSSKASGILV